MKKEVDDILFTLTKKMAALILEYNELKHEIVNDKIMLTNVETNTKVYYALDVKIKKKEQKLKSLKEEFIKEFRSSNIESVNEYLKIKE